VIEFANPAALLLLLPLLAFVLLVWRQYGQGRFRARLSLASRVAIFALLVLALAGLTLGRPLDRQAVVFVADLSASTLSAQADQARYISQAISAKDPDDAYAVIAAGGEPVVERVLSTAQGFDGFKSSVATDGSDLGAALRLAGALLPDGYRQRVVLLSDGQETVGDVVAQARLLRTRGVVVDVLPLDVWGGPEVLIDQVTAPDVAHLGERFGVRVQAVSNVETRATVRAYVNGTLLGEQTVQLGMGATDVHFNAEASESGLHDLRATISDASDTLEQNNEGRAVLRVQGPPGILVVEQRDGEAAAIASALSSAGMRVETRAPGGLPDQVDALGAFEAVVLADVSADSLTEAQHNALRSYVRDLGRGLLAIGGDSSFGQGEYIGTPLDDALPVRSSVRSHRDQGRVALVLVIDRSGSMADDIYNEGTSKLDMARQAAILSVQQLAPRDIIGVLAFDSFQHWVFPVNTVLSVGLPAIQERIGAITSEGGTEIFSALSAGFEAVRRTDAQYKHVILMTDGKSCCGGDYAGLLDRMHTNSVTLSTIAVGGDADQQLLSQLARQGEGRYYFAEHARDIPRLMTRETNLATRGPLVEGLVTPRQVSPDPTLGDVARNGLPALGGYLVTTPKDLADVLLVSDAADPILARWPYGLGRAVAWTSDLRGRWSGEWLDWEGMPRLFSSLVSWTIPASSGPLQVQLRAGPSTGHITVEESGSAPGGAMRARVAQPNGGAVEIDLSGTAPGRYEGEFPLVGPGTYLARVQQTRDGALVAAADAGLPVAYAAEFRRVSADPARMQQIALAGGGAVLDEAAPALSFADNLAPVTSPIPLERTLLAVAALLLPIDIALRRLRVSPAEALGLLRHPRTFLGALRFPWRSSASAVAERPAWVPRVPRRAAPPPVRNPAPDQVPLSATASPAVARQAEDEAVPNDDDALAETLRWLASRRRTTPDSH
jgi:Ca-activated chloride channel homolog